MSTPLPLDRYQRMRLDVGLKPDDSASLPDAVIDDAYARAGERYDDPVAESAAAHIVILEQLWASYATSTDYVQNESQEKASQRFANYGKLLEGWRKTLDDALAAGAIEAAGAVRSGRTRRKPPRLEEYPDSGWPWGPGWRGPGGYWP